MIKTKHASLFSTAAAFMVFCAGCAKEDVATPVEADTKDAPETSAPAEAQTIDLTETPDLFEQPVQANPLQPQPGDVTMTVNGTEITYGEVMQAVQQTMMQLSQQMPPQQLQQMYPRVMQEVTDSLIANVLLTDAAAASELVVSDSDLAQEIETIRASAPEGQTLEEALAANGIDFEEWKEDLRKQMLVGKFVEGKTADIAEASDEEVTTFYEENIEQFKTPESVEASHILLKTTEEDTEETKAEKIAQLEQIKADIEAGTATFADMATEHSDCPSSAQGGSLGSFGPGQMVPPFEEAAFAQEVGTLGDIVETQFGYHLIKVTDHQQEGTSSLEEVSEQLKGYLSNQKKQEALIAYVEELRAGAEIVEVEPDMDAGSTPVAAE